MTRKDDTQIAKEGLALARLFYSGMGYQVKEGYRFDLATHPQEARCWNMACVAYDHIAGTDLQSAVDALEEEP